MHPYAQAARSTAVKEKLPQERGAVASCLSGQMSVACRGVKCMRFVRLLRLDPRFGLSGFFHHVRYVNSLLVFPVNTDI